MSIENTTEEWRDIQGYEGCYQVSSLGRVRSLERIVMTGRGCRIPRRQLGRILIPRTVWGGYQQLALQKAGRGRQALVAHLVLETFVGPRPERMEACHGPDNNRKNNRLDNLRWDTRANNAHDRVRDGTQVNNRGERNHYAKVSDSDVLEMRRLHEEGESSKVLAEMFGITKNTVQCIVYGRTWKHLLPAIIKRCPHCGEEIP